ncbi:MAG: hypothetical protein ACYTF6_09745 [Planctomycetota bacterium]|jgi:hypothetical protein
MKRRPRPERPPRLSVAARLVIVGLAGCLLWAPAAAAEALEAAKSYLSESLRETARTQATLAVLKTIGDAELAAVFFAACRSEDKSLRLFATTALRDFAGSQVTAALLERLKTDQAMAVRAEALMALIAAKDVTDQQLISALGTLDQAIQLVAARELVRRGRARSAAETLSKLVGSKDARTAAAAGLALLAAGNESERRPLEQLMTNAETGDHVLAMLLEQIAEDEIKAASGLAELAAASSRPRHIRLLAYRALAATSGRAAAIIHDRISNSASMRFRVFLLRILADHARREAHLAELAKDAGAIGALARLELARPRGGSAARRAAEDIVALAHPVAVEYLLDRAAADITSRQWEFGFYAPALLKYVRSVPADSETMRMEYVRAARAAKLLADIGSPEALAGLKAILGERFSSRVRAAAAGLLRTQNRRASKLAMPLIDSPYKELAADAILALGRFGDPAATEHLGSIVLQRDRYARVVVTLASWYLLKSTGKAAEAAAELADCVK